MQLSDDNFDELVQKAAENYPLKTGNGDWDSFVARLNKNAFPNEAKQSRKWPYIALLLLFLACTGSMIINYFNNSNTKTSASHEQKALQGDGGKNKTGVGQPQTGGTTLNDKTIDHQSVSRKNSRQVTMSSFNDNNNDRNNSLRGEEPARQLAQVQTQSPADENDQSLSDQPNIRAEESENFDTGNQTSMKNPDNSNGIDKPENQNKKQAELKQPIKLLTRPSTFYGSFFAGPQLSTIKFQHPGKLGYRIGIALGYRVNNRLNVELAVQREDKSFFSDGKYFDNSKLKSKDIESLNGSAILTDIPVSVRYNFHSGNSGQFFATAGVSAILITHTEKYDYVVTKNGTPEDLSRSYSSLSGAKYFSNMNLSVGYEAPVGNTFRLKVEPYYQTHIQGFGIGNLPLSSFGLNIGISKDFK